MSKQPNIKRPRETLAGSSSLAAGKRVKFASEDATASTSRSNTTGGEGGDDFEEDLEGGSNSKKGVVTDGYDSDSSAGSDDGFGVGGGRKGKKNKDGTTGGGEDEEDDDDMFGGGDDSKKGGNKKSNGKGKEYLEMGDIEGQEFGKGEDEDEDDDDIGEEEYLEEDDLANDDDAPRSSRSKASMGYTLSSFNMADELSEGRFSADGTYTANPNDGLAVHDKWLDGVSKTAIKAARESKKRMDEEAKKREESSKGVEALSQEKDDCMIGILGIIREGETVARALARLGAGKKKVVRVKKVKAPVINDADAMELDDDHLPAPNTLASQATLASTTAPIEEDPATKRIKLLTHLASTLLATHGELEIYDQTYEDIIKGLKSEGAVRADWKPARDPTMIEESAAIARQEEENSHATSSTSINRPRRLIARPTAVTAPISTTKYFYKWVLPPAGQAPQDYGPYSSTEMNTWIGGGFFGPEGNGILVKKEGEGNWTSWKSASS